MVFSYYLLKLPYSLVFSFLNLLKKNRYHAAYIGDEIDYYIMRPVLELLPELKIICKNKSIKDKLNQLGVECSCLPAFPQGVLMCRHAAHKFPSTKIRKIGMRHGPFHFKALPDVDSFLLFHKFIFTSEYEARLAAKKGITNGVGIGYPKLDKAFDGSITDSYLSDLKEKLGFSNDKQTLLFTATWDGSGMSAIDKWYQRLEELTDEYNLLVSLHPWVSDKYKSGICTSPNVHFIDSYDTTAYIMLADICIGDTSSMLGECIALDKPLITFKVNSADRMVDYVIDMLQKVSVRIDDFEEIRDAIRTCFNRIAQEDRMAAKELMFSNLDGSASEKVATLVRQEFDL